MSGDINPNPGPVSALAAGKINCPVMNANDDINTDWHQWKDTFHVAVSDYIQTKRLRARNPVP